jgi:MFS family permease
VLLVLSFLLGIITSIDMPARQTGVPQMIEHPSQLQSALSLQSGSFNLARLIGPAIAGFVVKAGGELACFLLNAIAHTAVLYAFLLMRLPPREMASRSQKPLHALREGFAYSMSIKPITYSLLFTYAFCFFSLPYVIMLPLFAKEVLAGDSRHLGSLLGALGIGALIGVMFMAARVGARQLPRYFVSMQIMFGIVFCLFSQMTDWRFSVALMPLVGYAVVSAAVASNSLIQVLVDENKRGRVLSLYVLGTLGFGPIGMLCFGHLADLIGTQPSALICGCMACLVGIVHAGRLRVYARTVDPILKAKGL